MSQFAFCFVLRWGNKTLDSISLTPTLKRKQALVKDMTT